MKILVTGANGQLGYKIKEVLGSSHNLILTDRANLDITNQKAVADFIEAEKPEIILHAAAFTNVDLAEAESDICRLINVDGTYHLARAAKETDIFFIYISTDYVFDGESRSPYTEIDKPQPLSVYGETKYAGEKIVRQEVEKFYIIRTAWVFGETPEGYIGANFIQKMIKLAQERDQLNVVNDQIGSPTYTKDLVDVIRLFIDRSQLKQLAPFGIYHFSGEGETSWFDFAKEIFQLSNIQVNLQPITSNELPLKASRPKYSYMSKKKIEKELGIKVRSWKEMLSEYLNSKS